MAPSNDQNSNGFPLKLREGIQSKFLKSAVTNWAVITLIYMSIAAASSILGNDATSSYHERGKSQNQCIFNTFKTLLMSTLTFMCILMVMHNEMLASTGVLDLKFLLELAYLSVSQYLLFYMVNFVYLKNPIIQHGSDENDLVQLNPALIVTISYNIFLCLLFIIRKKGYKILDEELNNNLKVRKPLILSVPYTKIIKSTFGEATKLFITYSIFHFFIGDSLYSLGFLFLRKVFKLRLNFLGGSVGIYKDYKLMASIYITGYLILVLLSITSYIYRKALSDASDVSLATMKLGNLINIMKSPRDKYERYIALREMSHLAEYNSNFRDEVYMGNEVLRNDLYEVLLNDIFFINKKIISRLVEVKYMDSRKSDEYDMRINDSGKGKLNIYAYIYMYLLKSNPANIHDNPEQTKSPDTPSKAYSFRKYIIDWLLTPTYSNRLFVECTQKKNALVFTTFQSAIWAAKCISSLVFYAAEDSYEMVNDILPIVLPAFANTVNALDCWLNYTKNYLTTCLHRTAYTDDSIRKANVLKGVIETCIYRIISIHYNSLQKCDFSNESCYKLQVFVDFKY